MNELELKSSATGMSLGEMKNFIRNHFEEFVNRKNLDIADVNFAADFVDHGADVPPGTPAGAAGAKQYAVSYTHLDVYKRQGVCGELALPQRHASRASDRESRKVFGGFQSPHCRRER